MRDCMETNFNAPKELIHKNIETGVRRVSTPVTKLCILGIMAGMAIAFGATASSAAMHDIANVGLARLVAGCVFPVGLMIILFVGGELFTGNCLMVMGMLDHEYRIRSAVRVLFTVFVTNMIGAVLIAFLVSQSGQFDFTGGTLGAFTIKVAVNKVNIPFGRAVVSGILCNILVCIAILMAAAAKDIAGKVWACFFPIMAFVICGFEHCVANMYYISAGIFASMNDLYVDKAMELYGFTAEQINSLGVDTFLISLIPVTIGNILGGMVFVGLPLYFIHRGKTEIPIKH